MYLIGNGEIDFDEFKVMVGQSWFIESYHNKLAQKTQRMLSFLNIGDDGVEFDEDEDEKTEIDNNDHDEMQNEIQAKNEQIEELQKEIEAQKESELHKVGELEKEIQSLRMEKKQTQSDVDKLQKEKDKIATESNAANQMLLKEIDALKESMEEKDRTISDLKHVNEVKSLKEENEALKEDYNREREENEAYKKLLEEVERLRAEKKQNEKDIEELKRENAELKASIIDIDIDDDNKGRDYKSIGTTETPDHDDEPRKSTLELLDHDALSDKEGNYIMQQAQIHQGAISGGCCSKFFSLFQTNTVNQVAKKPTLYHDF